MNKKFLKFHLTNVREERWNFPAINLKLPVKSHLNNRKQQYLSESSDDNKKKMKDKPSKEIYGYFKKIKPPMFNGEIEKSEEVESWLSRMKKVFPYIQLL